jgi:hypothetical protein
MCSSSPPWFRRRVGGSFGECLERPALRQGHKDRENVLWVYIFGCRCVQSIAYNVCINDDGCLLLSKITWIAIT